jgi:hypothetical protein
MWPFLNIFPHKHCENISVRLLYYGPYNLLTVLPVTVHICNQHDVAPARLTTETSGSLTPLPKKHFGIVFISSVNVDDFEMCLKVFWLLAVLPLSPACLLLPGQKLAK